MKVDDQLIVFPFKDQHWVRKFVVGGLLALCGMVIPLFLIPVSGYMMRIIRRTLDDDTPSLPDWDDWGDLILSGLKAWLVTIVYSLPLWAMILCSQGAITAGVLTTTIGIAEESPLALGGIALALMGFASFGVATILTFPLMFLSPVALARMVAHDSVGSAFQLGEVWRELKTGFKHYILAFVVYLALSMGASLVATLMIYSVCLTCLSPFAYAVAVVYAFVMQGTLYGLAYRETQALARPEGKQAEAAG